MGKIATMSLISPNHDTAGESYQVWPSRKFKWKLEEPSNLDNVNIRSRRGDIKSASTKRWWMFGLVKVLRSCDLNATRGRAIKFFLGWALLTSTQTKTIGRADKADKVCIETKPLTTDNVNHQNVQRYKNSKKIGRQIWRLSIKFKRLLCNNSSKLVEIKSCVNESAIENNHIITI